MIYFYYGLPAVMGFLFIRILVPALFQQAESHLQLHGHYLIVLDVKLLDFPNSLDYDDKNWWNYHQVWKSQIISNWTYMNLKCVKLIILLKWASPTCSDVFFCKLWMAHCRSCSKRQRGQASTEWDHHLPELTVSPNYHQTDEKNYSQLILALHLQQTVKTRNNNNCSITK